MAENRNGQITETTVEARQAERGPTIFNVLALSLGACIILLAVVWYIFFRT